MNRLLMLLAFLLVPLHGLHAQTLEINPISGSAAALPIAVVPFDYLGASVAPDVDLAAVVRADLNRSGSFRTLADRDLVERPLRQSDVNFGTWRLLRQDYLLVGRVLDDPAGGYRTEFELFDVAKQERLLGLALSGRPGNMRDIAHQVADHVYEKILGTRGAFWTRMAYVTAVGLGRDTTYSLMIADADGHNPQTVVRSREPLLSPAWSPDGKRLAYVSFERGASSIYIQEIATGAREVVSSFKGINGAPAFSPDGSKLALALSRTGNPEIYVMDLASRALTQLTNHWSIDTEPGSHPMAAASSSPPTAAESRSCTRSPSRVGSPPRHLQRTVQRACHDRAGRPHRYGARGRKRLSYRCSGSQVRQRRGDALISPGNLDESPSFAPNGSMILYATRENQRGVLYVVSADARVRQRLVLADGDVREPAWSPFRQR